MGSGFVFGGAFFIVPAIMGIISVVVVVAIVPAAHAVIAAAAEQDQQDDDPAVVATTKAIVIHRNTSTDFVELWLSPPLTFHGIPPTEKCAESRLPLAGSRGVFQQPEIPRTVWSGESVLVWITAQPSPWLRREVPRSDPR